MSNGRLTLDGLIFDHLIFTPFLVTVGCVRSKTYVRPCILDDAVMHEVVKGAYLRSYNLHAQRTGLFCVSCANTGLSLYNVQFPRTTCQCSEKDMMGGN